MVHILQNCCKQDHCCKTRVVLVLCQLEAHETPQTAIPVLMWWRKRDGTGIQVILTQRSSWHSITWEKELMRAQILGLPSWSQALGWRRCQCAVYTRQMVGSKDSSPEGAGSVEWLVGVQSPERPQRRPGLGLLSVCKVGLPLLQC